MDAVRLDQFGEELADRALVGIGRVGRAHHLAVAGDGILAFEHLHDDRARGHEGDQIVEEGPLAMDAVKALGLLAGHPDPLRGDDAKARFLEHRR